MPVAATLSPRLKIALGTHKTGLFDAGVPVLGGEAIEELFRLAQPGGRTRTISLFRTGGWLLGAAVVPLVPGLEEAARDLYRNIFEATKSLQLARIWNYVPAINEFGPTGLENYRAFCQGRSLAFEQHYGSGFKAFLPAASAVGNKSASLTVVFAACAGQPRHVENPRQISAYDYPEAYGPRAPSFARATVVPGPDASTVFISGTAAIRGHQTIAPHRIRPQLECTVENLREVSRATGLGPDLDHGGRSTRHFKVYLRHAADQPWVAAHLEDTLLAKSDCVSYLLADICRAELLVEIEVSLFGVKVLEA